MESGSLKGKLSCTTAPREFHTPTRRNIIGPTGRDILYIPNEKCLYFTIPAGGRFFSLPSNKPSPGEPLQLSQWIAITTLNSHLPPIDFLFKTPPPNFFVFFYKVIVLCLLDLSIVLAVPCSSPISSLLFLNKPIFCW